MGPGLGTERYVESGRRGEMGIEGFGERVRGEGGFGEKGSSHGRH